MSLQGTPIVVDFYLLPLGGCDVVLGVQWLRTLEPISWDFSKLQMKFILEGNEVILRGNSTPDNKFVEDVQISREINKKKQRAILQLYSINLGRTEYGPSLGDPKLQILLSSYKVFFFEPQEFPPTRTHDIQILLVQGSGAVSIMSYRYPFYQKHEIEKMVSNVISTGIIQPSNSSYSSPVLLVKKHDGSWRLCIDYRALDKITVKDKFPIPVVDELLDKLHGSRFFTKLDLQLGYYQI